MSNVSPTLGINEQIHALRATGRNVVHLGFGQSPFPPPGRIIETLRDNAGESAYLPVAGLPELRKAVAAHQQRLTGIDAEDFHVLVAPGSKLILFAAQMAIEGDLLLPRPSWVSYAPQAYMLKQRVAWVPTQLHDHSYFINESDLSKTLREARKRGLNPTKLLINFPNNPTGLTIADENLQAIAAFCVANGITLISDEIYGRVAFDSAYRSAASYAPEHTIVSTGLSKHLSIGGWRLGVALIPKSKPDLWQRLQHMASETWSCVATPIQIAAIDAYSGHDDVEADIKDSTAIHAAVTTHLAEQLQATGVDCPLPAGGFYVWPDFDPVLRSRFETSVALSQSLLNTYNVASLPGVSFGEAESSLRLRLAACDYDGGTALKRYRQRAGVDTSMAISDLVPEMARGTEQLCAAIRALLASPDKS